MALKTIRVIAAIAVFVSLTFFFLDFAGVLPDSFNSLAHIQFIPAVLSLSFGILAGLVLLTFLFGRIYCSVICPTGVFQDIAGRCSRIFSRKKKRFKYSKPRTLLRWVVVVAATLAAGLGFTLLLGLLDPYSIYGRFATNLFRPLYLLGNNLLAGFFTARGNYTFYYTDAGIMSVSAFIIALAMFLGIGYMGWRHGRTYCNTICPVGTILGLMSRFSLWKIRIDKAKCTSCGICAAKCKGMCIDPKGKTVDSSRCVACYNCLGSCRFGALSYCGSWKKNTAQAGPASGDGVKIKSGSSNTVAETKRRHVGHGSKDKGTETGTKTGTKTAAKTGAETGTEAGTEAGTKTAAETGSEMKAQSDLLTGMSRRRFLLTSLGAAAAVPYILAGDTLDGLQILGTSKVPYKRANPIGPPGAGSIRKLMSKCTSCHLCVSKCPQHIIKPSYTEYGLSGFMMPTVTYEKGYCSYDCTVCADVCPNGALTPLSVDEKHTTQIGRVVLIEDNCVVHTDGTSCGACSEHCPTQAVTMIPFRNGLTKPQIDPDICVGCGGCEFICPVRPFRAIYVNGNPVQHERKAFVEEEKMEINFDGFGF